MRSSEQLPARTATDFRSASAESAESARTTRRWKAVCSLYSQIRAARLSAQETRRSGLKHVRCS